MKLNLNIGNKKYDIELNKTNNGTINIKVDGEDFLFQETKEEKEEPLIAKPSLPKRNFSEKEIKAPISGIISEVFVKANDVIKQGEKVALLSAMKMENEIVSDFSGKIKTVLIKQEQRVKEGDLLVVLD